MAQTTTEGMFPLIEAPLHQVRTPLWDFQQQVEDAIGGIFIDVTRPAYGAVGDGVADDTAAIQAALDLFAYNGSLTGGRIVIPNGIYNHTGLTYRGDGQTSFVMEGVDTGAGFNGVELKYIGSSGGTVFQMLGANHCTLKNIGLNGNALAKVGLLVDYDTSRSMTSFNCVFNQVIIGGVTGTDSICYQVGTSNSASAEHAFLDCHAVGHSTPGTTYYGIKVAGSNCKNIRWLRGGLGRLKWGADPGNSGYFVLEGVSFYFNTEADIYPFASEVTMIGCGSEGSSRLLGGFAASPTTAGGLTMSGSYWAGIAPADDYIYDFPGRAFITGSRFDNGRTSGSWPKFKAYLDGNVLGPSFVSINNCYGQDTPSAVIPVYNSSDALVGSTVTGPVRLVSINDFARDMNGTTPTYNFPTILPDINQGVPKTVTASGAYFATVLDSIILMSASGGANYVQLPTAAEAGANKRYLLVKTDASANLVSFYSPTSTINGVNQIDLTGQYDFCEIVSNGSAYFVVRESVPAAFSLTGGAANKLAVWVDSDTLTNDAGLHWENDHLGIGTASHNYPIDLGTGTGKKVAVYNDSGGTTFYGFGIGSSLMSVWAGDVEAFDVLADRVDFLQDIYRAGNKVVSTRGAAVASVASANASDLATAITLVNELKAQFNTLLTRFRATGGHGSIAD